MLSGLAREQRLRGLKSNEITSKRFDKKGRMRNKISDKSKDKRLRDLRKIKKREPALVAIEQSKSQVTLPEESRRKQVSFEFYKKTCLWRQHRDEREAALLQVPCWVIQHQKNDGRIDWRERNSRRSLFEADQHERFRG